MKIPEYLNFLVVMKKKKIIIILSLSIYGLLSGCNDRDKPFQETLDLLQGVYVISEARFLDSQYSDSVVYEIGVMSFDPCLYNHTNQDCSGYIQAYPLEVSEKDYFFFNLDSDDWNELIVFPETVSDIIRINNLIPIDIMFDESEVILEIFNRDRVSRIPPYPYRIVLTKP